MSELVAGQELRLDSRDHAAWVAGRWVKLTPTQFRLLECLLDEPERVFQRAELVGAIIAGGAIVLERTIDVHVAALRRKLGVPGLIETVRGKGYRLTINRERPLAPEA